MVRHPYELADLDAGPLVRRHLRRSRTWRRYDGRGL